MLERIGVEAFGLAVAGEMIGDVLAPHVLISSATRCIGTIVPDVTVREVHTDEDAIERLRSLAPRAAVCYGPRRL